MRPIMLGELIDTLTHFYVNESVTYAMGYVGKPTSWRGSYNELTLPPESEAVGICTVGDLAKALIAADGATFGGWKGGEYVMNRNTFVWADEPGGYTCEAVLGVRMCSYRWTRDGIVNGSAIQLVTMKVDY